MVYTSVLGPYKDGMLMKLDPVSFLHFHVNYPLSHYPSFVFVINQSKSYFSLFSLGTVSSTSRYTLACRY
jgi:hypothetical protein